MDRKYDAFILDVDNTILDTNNHFRKAQRSMLEPLENRGVIEDADNHIRKLREIDTQIAELEGKNEYEFRKLSRALALFYLEDIEKESAVTNRDDETSYDDYVETATNNFYTKLNSPHEIYPDFFDIYKELKDFDSVSVIAFSEGEQKRVVGELEHHSVIDIFEDVITGDKNPESFSDIRERFSIMNGLVVGDSLRSDIMPANKAGFTTVHKPAGFCEDDADIEPDFEISRISELKSLM